MFLCAKWIRLPDGVARCDKPHGHEGRHEDSVIAVCFEDRDVVDRVKPYQHYKGGLYSVFTTMAKHAERKDLPQQVVYASMTDGKVWLRDFDDFHAPIPIPYGVDHEGRMVIPPGGSIRRFTFLKDWKA